MSAEREREHYKAALELIASPNRATYERPLDAWKIATAALRGEDFVAAASEAEQAAAEAAGPEPDFPPPSVAG